MRYGRAERLIQLALEMQSARGGVSIAEIQEKFEVSRRTAIRMRDAVLRAFPQGSKIETGERAKRWALPRTAAQTFVDVTSDDLANLEVAAEAMRKANLQTHAEGLRMLGAKIRNSLSAGSLPHIEPDLEALTEAEGIALRPGPKPFISPQTIETLRTAIKSCRKVTFRYASRAGGKAVERTVSPLGFLYGHRHYLVGVSNGGSEVRFYSLPAIANLKLEDESFERDKNFTLRNFISNSFGIFEEKPYDVVWRFSKVAAPLAKQFVFHPSQAVEEDEAGRLLVSFKAGGLLEMAWHLVKWGDEVEVLSPQKLQEMMPAVPFSWPALP
jgi:predicted DNA-binding transcriptional regulator YafY